VRSRAAADRVAGHHRDDRLREPPDLDLQVEDVQASDPLLVDVAVVAPDLLIATRREGFGPLAGEDHDPDRRVVARHLEGRDQLLRRERPERVAHLGPVDRDLRDALGGFVADVGPVPARLPVDHVTTYS
jgi:hypothetical protein